ncbi:MAG: hypothetical protein Kow00120_14360 [Anaerolineae bacterium]
MSEKSSPEQLVQQLREATLAYEALDAAIDALLSEYGGHSDNMPQAARARYRELAAQRADAYNRMKALERALFDDV